MTSSVSVLGGEVTKNWIIQDGVMERRVILFHDPFTGVRCLAIDNQEVPKSNGNTSVFIRSHKIPFVVGTSTGFVSINRRGYTQFTYECQVNGQVIPEAADAVRLQDGTTKFTVSIESWEMSKNIDRKPVIWYLVQTTREFDGATTTCHRRYRDFTHLHDNVSSALNGNDARRHLPSLPGKQVKLLVDHVDESFIDSRRRALQRYLTAMIAIPQALTCLELQAFLGLSENVREFSILCTYRSVGCQFQDAKQGDMGPLVTSVTSELFDLGLRVGAILTKINGSSTSSRSFKESIRMMESLPRPMVLHFEQSLMAEDVGLHEEEKREEKTEDDEDEVKLPEVGDGQQLEDDTLYSI